MVVAENRCLTFDSEPGSPEQVSVLLVEDNLPDARLVQELLRESSAPSFEVSCVAQLSEACSELAESNPQCVLLDLLLPDARWLEAPARVHEIRPDLPMVVLSGINNQPLALEALREGAQDYLIKGKIDGDELARSILYSIERKRMESRAADYALHDPVTGLCTPALFDEYLEHALARLERQNAPISVLVLAIDSPELGYPKVQRLALGEITRRLEVLLRRSDIVAWFGGSEFAILCEGADATVSAIIANRIESSLIDWPLSLDDRDLRLVPRVGIASTSSARTLPDALLDEARANV
jgi:two-component system, cell cycle response regulator